MTNEKNLELIVAAQLGDEQAKERLLADNAALIWSVVRRFTGRGTDMEDLYQLGCVGFIKAIDGFDLTYGTQFSTYAVPKITGEIRRFLRDDGMIKVSRSIRDNATKIAAAKNRLEIELGRAPHLSELAKATGFTVEEIAVCENAVVEPDSLQRDTTGDGMTLEHAIGTEGIEEGVLEHIALSEAVRELPERERKVIYLRYFKDMTQERAARILNVSQVQISRIERRAIGLLREKIG